MALSVSSPARADENLRGVISSRGDGTFVLETDGATSLIVIVNDSTTIKRTNGIVARTVSAANLMPGLRVHVEGDYEGPTRFVAERISFSQSDLKIARAIEAGLANTDKRSVANQQQISEQTLALLQHDRSLTAQGQRIASHDDLIAANAERIVGTSGAIAATNVRIGNLDDYESVSSITVYFANGSARIAKKYRSELEQFAARATAGDGYVVQVQAYASAVGSAARNQALSQQRTDAVTAVLHQQGVPPTSMVAPAAMGTMGQVAPNTTSKGQQANRRAVVTLLRNTGVASK